MNLGHLLLIIFGLVKKLGNGEEIMMVGGKTAECLRKEMVYAVRAIQMEIGGEKLLGIDDGMVDADAAKKHGVQEKKKVKKIPDGGKLIPDVPSGKVMV